MKGSNRVPTSDQHGLEGHYNITHKDAETGMAFDDAVLRIEPIEIIFMQI